MEFGSKDFNDILKDFKKGRDWLNDVTIDIEDGGNKLDPATMLRAYEEEATIDNSIALASQMVLNKHVKFCRGDEVILEFTYNGGELGDKFEEAPYLFDMLLKLCYGILVKKLTPPSRG